MKRHLLSILLLVAAAGMAVAQGRYVFPTEVKPLTHTVWGQDAPFNKRCPVTRHDTVRAYAGCGPLVMSQVMRRWSYPPSSPQLGSAYRWDLMFDVYADSVTAQQEDAVARLIADCGRAAHTDYGQTASATKLNDVVTGLKKYFGYNPYMAITDRANYTGTQGDRTWKSLIYQELKGGRPVIIRGEKGPRAAHVFIIDGCRDSLVHVNFGWGGKRNGYYDPDQLDGYRLNQRMLVDIAPQGYRPAIRRYTVSQPGRLQSLITAADRRTLRHIKVVGPINGRDIALLRQMAGGRRNGRHIPGNLATIDLSEAVILTLPDSAFYGCENLTYVSLPLTLPEISTCAFASCSRLNRVDIHSMVADIKAKAFSACFSLTAVSLPFGLKTIGANAFNSCHNLTDVYLPPMLTTIGNGAFANASRLSQLTLPRATKHVGRDIVKGTQVKNIRRL